MLKNKKILYIFIFLLMFLLFISTNSFASSGSEETDAKIKNNFLIIKGYVEANYGTFNDYVITRASNGYTVYYVLNPSGGYVKNNGKGLIQSNYSLIFDGVYTDVSQVTPLIDHWNSSPNASTYTNVSDIIFTTVAVSGSSCTDTLGDLTIPEEPDTPTETPQEVRGTIAPVAKEMKMEMVLQEIVKILPLIIVVVVSLVGLRKALRLLLTLLRKA